MNCYKVKEKLSGFLDRALPAEEMRQLESHLERCPDCSVEFSWLGQINDLMQRDLFPAPDDDYWVATPKIIARRLGLTSKTSTERFFYAFKTLLPAPRLRWAMAGAVAIFALVFSIITFDLTKPELTQIEVGKDPIAKNTKKNENRTAAQESPTDEPAEAMIAEERSESAINSKVQEGENTTTYEEIGFLADALDRINNIQPHPLRDGTAKALRFEQELIPLPTTEFLTTLAIADAEETVSAPLVQTFARDRDFRQAPGGAKSENSDQVGEKTESSFAETMWIVQESPGLSEKKNIWLSYLSRENDPTYHSLGVYNLALVLAKIAEESNTPEKAREALQFFEENEESLRFQMSDSRYELKINAFHMIINQ